MNICQASHITYLGAENLESTHPQSQSRDEQDPDSEPDAVNLGTTGSDQDSQMDL